MEKLERFLQDNFGLEARENAFQNRKIHTLEVELTDICNLSCHYCYAESNSQKNSLSLDKAKDFLLQAKNYGIREIWWLGGEPLMNPDWAEIISFSKDLNIQNLLCSNGTLLKGKNARIIPQIVDLFVLHLDSIDNDIFLSCQENESNFYNKILDGFDELLMNGFDPENVRLNLTLTKRTYPTIEDTMRYFIDKGIQTVTLIPLYPCGFGKKLPDSEFLNKAQHYNAFETRAMVESRPELMFLGTSEFFKQYQLTNAFVKSNGDVTPYAGIDISAGNIYRQNLGKILEEHFDMLSFSDYVDATGKKNKINGKCGDCESSRFCFGTRVSSYLRKGLGESDPTCWKT